MSTYKEDLLAAKRRLYSVYLKAPIEEITTDDLDLMDALSRDSQIQEHLQKFINKERLKTG